MRGSGQPRRSIASVTFGHSSRNQPLKAATFAIVASKPSHTAQVQLAAVMPPARIASKTSRLQFETTSPSKTTASVCSDEPTRVTPDSNEAGRGRDDAPGAGEVA